MKKEQNDNLGSVAKQVVKIFFIGFIFVSVLMGRLSTLAFTEGRPVARVINGSDADEGEWPWMVALLKETSRGLWHICGGALIGSQYVVTAAHCVADFPADTSALKVLAGRTRLSSNAGILVDVNSVVVHPGYNPTTIANDIALLTLSRPINLPLLSLIGSQEQYLASPGSQAYVLGWGSTSTKLIAPADMLQEALVPIIPNADCRAAMGPLFNPEVMLCAGVQSSHPHADNGIDSCYGDSGGPLVVPDGTGVWRLAGIVSWGYACAAWDGWGVYTRASVYTSWLSLFTSAPPSFLQKPSISGRAIVGRRLKCVPGRITGVMPIQLSYAWYSYDPISGLDSPASQISTDSLLLTSELLGKGIYCSVTASNATGKASARSKRTRLIRNNRDTIPPKVTFKGSLCSVDRCNLFFLIKDDSGPATIKYVHGFYQKMTSSIQPQRPPHRSLLIKALPREDFTWVFSVPQPQNTTRFAVYVRAVDLNRNGARLWRRFRVSLPGKNHHT